MQLKEEFLKLYFPAGISHNDTDFMFSKFLCRDMLEEKGTASKLAIDALAFIQLGTAQRDERLIHAARSRYHAAVTCLNVDLAESNAMYNDGVLSASYILGFCEVFHPLCPTGRPWQAHHRGLQDLLVARGPDGEYSRFAQLFLYNFRHVAANAGNSARRKVPIAGKDWKLCAATTDVFMATLSDHIIALPEALQRADAAIQRGSPSSLYESIMELASYERSMQAWLVCWYSSFEKLPYHHEVAENYLNLQSYAEGAPPSFPKVLRFPHFSQASAQSVYWIALLQIKQTICEVNTRFRLPILPKAEATLVSEANDIAEKLCQCVGWMSQPRFGFCGVLSSKGALHYASLWYSKRLDLQKIAWCQKVGKSLEIYHCLGDIYQRSFLQPNAEQKDEEDAEHGGNDQPETPP